MKDQDVKLQENLSFSDQEKTKTQNMARNTQNLLKNGKILTQTADAAKIKWGNNFFIFRQEKGK